MSVPKSVWSRPNSSTSIPTYQYKRRGSSKSSQLPHFINHHADKMTAQLCYWRKGQRAVTLLLRDYRVAPPPCPLCVGVGPSTVIDASPCSCREVERFFPAIWGAYSVPRDVLPTVMNFCRYLFNVNGFFLFNKYRDALIL